MYSRRSRGYIIFYLVYHNITLGRVPLEVVSDNHSSAPIYVQQGGIVVLDRHLVL